MWSEVLSYDLLKWVEDVGYKFEFVVESQRVLIGDKTEHKEITSLL